MKFSVDGFDGAEGLALRNVDNVRGTHTVGKILARRRVNAPSIAEKREDPRLIEDAPVRNAIAKGADIDVNVIGEALGKIAIGPPAGFFQFLGEIPMVERAERADFRFEKSVG